MSSSTSLIASLALIFVSFTSSAQQAPGGAVPIRFIVTDNVKSHIGGRVTLMAKNETAKPINSYVLGIRFYTPDGKENGSSSHITIRGLQAGPSSYAANEAWPEVLNVPVNNGEIVKYSIFVDYVLFSDNTTWGKNTMSMGQHIEGVKSGVLSERRRLKQLLQKNGPAAVEQDLNR